MECFEDRKWMELALEQAKEAYATGEIPVGAVIVKNGEVIAAAHNRCERDRDATAHAERLAISEACQTLGSWRLSDCTLYVTLEPCPMCAGAAINARVGRIVYGIRDARAGALGSLINLPAYPLEGKPECLGGVMEEECRMLLRAFFSSMRQKKKEKIGN